MSIEQELFETGLSHKLALEDVVQELVNQVVGKLGAELSEVFARIGQIVSNERNEILHMIHDGRHI